MKILSVFVIIMILGTSCTNIEERKTPLQSEKGEYMVDTNDEFYDIVFNESGYTLQDLDNFYRKIKESLKGDKNYNNLRKTIISTMCQRKNLIEVEDKALLEYYVNEIISMPFISDMEEFHLMLQGMVGFWDNEKISNTAGTMVSRNHKYIIDNFNEPVKVLNSPNQVSGSYSMMLLADISQ